MQIIAGFALLLGLLLFLRWFAQATPQTVVRTAKWTGAAILIGGGALMLATGRAGWALAVLAGFLPWAMRAVQVHSLYRTLRLTFGRLGMGGAKTQAGRTSKVETRFLSMTLDHSSGTLTGKVVDGPFRGRRLNELSFDEAMELFRQCAADPQSAQVLEAWLDRTWPDWREQAHQRWSQGRSSRDSASSSGPSSGRMSREEALAVLGLEPGASAEEIKAAHRRLMAAAHPDRGGSNYLAAKINQAKDVLLGGK